MPEDEKLIDMNLSDEDVERFHDPLINEEMKKAIWREIGEREGFYPGSVEWVDDPESDNTRFRARPIDRYTSVQDIENGWDHSDWIDGWGGGENWRIQLNRRLNDLERKRLIPRLQAFQDSGPTLDDMVVLFMTLCEPDLAMIKCRVQRIEAVEIKDKWLPIFPPPADITITIAEQP